MVVFIVLSVYGLTLAALGYIVGKSTADEQSTPQVTCARCGWSGAPRAVPGCGCWSQERDARGRFVGRVR